MLNIKTLCAKLQKVTLIGGDIIKRIILSLNDIRLLKKLNYETSLFEKGGKTCLIQMPYDFWLFMRVLSLLKILKPKKTYAVQIYFPTTYPKKFISRIIRIIQESSFLNYKWALYYRALGVRPSIDFKRVRRDQSKFDEIFSKLTKAQTKREFSQIHFEDIRVGDLIYDTYIRFKPAPTIDLDDPFLNVLTVKALDIYLECKRFLENHHIDILVTTYTCYIHHGILTRLCLNKGIEVNALGALNQLIVQPTIEYPLHKRHAHKYKIWAEQYPNQNEMLTAAKELLEKRLNGFIDPVTSYMKVSAYANKSALIQLNPNKKSAIIMAHDFYDSPHGWGDMLFEDFHQWFDFLLPIASSTDHDFYLKPHPNAIPANVAIYESFLRKFPKIKRVDPSISNVAIASSGFTCAFTLYGTIAHEFAYMGLPTISAGSNPHKAFNFTRVPANLNEYEMWIKKLEAWIPNKDDVLKFVFMHNYCVIKNDLAPLKSIETAKQAITSYDTEFDELVRKMSSEYNAITNKQSLY